LAGGRSRTAGSDDHRTFRSSWGRFRPQNVVYKRGIPVTRASTPQTAVELREGLSGWPREVVRAAVLAALSGVGSADALAPVLAHWLTDIKRGGEVPHVRGALLSGMGGDQPTQAIDERRLGPFQERVGPVTLVGSLEPRSPAARPLRRGCLAVFTAKQLGPFRCHAFPTDAHNHNTRKQEVC
jgi:hypothetical protein